MYIPSEGAKKKLKNLPLLRSDLVNDQFHDVLETEAKHIGTAKKLSLHRATINMRGGT